MPPVDAFEIVKGRRTKLKLGGSLVSRPSCFRCGSLVRLDWRMCNGQPAAPRRSLHD
jgi:hypothetical protein